MISTPRGLRPHIVLLGPRNSGKSSLINRITGRELAIVSETPGTTTDPVYKGMELLPFGPVVFVDTAGIDDEGALGTQRVGRTRRAERGADVTLYVTSGSMTEAERRYLREHRADVLVAVTNRDRRHGEAPLTQSLRAEGITALEVSNVTGAGVEELKRELISLLETRREQERALLQNMISRYSFVLMVVPIDLEAPRGRLILPQVQTIREILDADAATLVVKEREVDWALSQLKRAPDLAITDSQVVQKAAGSIPPEIPLTTFSVLFSRLKGDLARFVEGAGAIDRLEHGDRVLLAESCTHHAHSDDIGRVKIPRWLRQYTGKDLDITVQGGGYPDDIADYALVIHCGACMLTRKMMLSRLDEAVAAGVPVTNYGIAISHLHGLLDRVLEPFGEELRSGR
ncbi:MAG: [FeFe] hydrogenase H-cluster maturation GTPase HydF [Spirochaetaceae bacterium]